LKTSKRVAVVLNTSDDPGPVTSDADRPRKPILSLPKRDPVSIVEQEAPPDFPDFTYDRPDDDEFLSVDAYTTSRKKARKDGGAKRQRASRRDSKWQ